MMNSKPYIPESQTSFLQLGVDTIKERPRTIFLISLLLAIIGIVVISLVPNQYKAITTILVDPQKIPERYVASTITSDPNAHLNTLTQQVLSTSRLQEIVDQLNLYPEMRKKKSREETLDYIRGKITIELKPGAEQGLSSFSIAYVDADRLLVAPVANQLAESFIDWNLKSRQQQAIVTTQFLSNQLEKAQESLEEQESALQTFRMQHVGGTPDQLDGNLQALSRLQADVQSNMDAVSRLDEERILVSQPKSTEAREPASLNERERLTREANRLENELANLRRQYTDTYPDVLAAKSQLETVNARLARLPEMPAQTDESLDSSTHVRISLINKEIERHKERLSTLQRQIGAYQDRVQSVPVLETKLAELTRNYETSKQNYQSLLDKKLSAGMSEDLERKQQAERFNVLDLARTPEKPFKPKRLPLMAGTPVAAFLLVTGVMILFTHLRGAVRSKADLVTVLSAGVPVLGTVPAIASDADERLQRASTWKVAVASVLACSALVVFLMKVRPVL